MIEVKVITENHTHNNQPVPAGEVILVEETQAKWLVSQKIGTIVPKKDKE